MITNLYERSPDVIGGHEIDVVQNNIRNQAIHASLEQMARLQIFLLECDSNNTNSKMKPSDIRGVRAQWDICKQEFEFGFADENNDLPMGAYEYAYQIYTIHQKEIARIRNVKVKKIATVMWNTMNFLLSVDSANTQGYVAEEDADAILQRFAYVDRVMDEWIGNGTDFSDTGRRAPAYEILGRVQPDVDSDFARMLEPSKKLPDPRIPDVPDSPSEGK